MMLREELAVHAVSPGMVGGDLLHIPQQGTGFELAAEIAVTIQRGHRL